MTGAGTPGATDANPAVGRVRVLIFVQAAGHDVDDVYRAYHRVSRALLGTPGLLGNELLSSVGDPGSFAVLSEWSDLEAFTRWERGSAHRDTTSPLRPYQDGSAGSPFRIYQVVAGYAGAPLDPVGSA